MRVNYRDRRFLNKNGYRTLVIELDFWPHVTLKEIKRVASGLLEQRANVGWALEFKERERLNLWAVERKMKLKRYKK